MLMIRTSLRCVRQRSHINATILSLYVFGVFIFQRGCTHLLLLLVCPYKACFLIVACTKKVLPGAHTYHLLSIECFRRPSNGQRCWCATSSDLDLSDDSFLKVCRVEKSRASGPGGQHVH